MISNQDALKFQNINIEEDLYKLIPHEDLPESYNFFEGQNLEITSESASRGINVLSNAVKDEFLRIIQSNKKKN